MVLRLSSVCACASEDAASPPNAAAPEATAPCRKLRREPSAGAGTSVAVVDVSDSGVCESMRFLSQISSDFVECGPVEHRPAQTHRKTGTTWCSVRSCLE